MRRNRLISLLLALILCVSLAAPALATEATTKVIVDGCFQITMDGFLRVDTYHYYNSTPSYDISAWELGVSLTFYVVADNSTLTVEAAPGYHYAADPLDYESGAAYYAPGGLDWTEANQRFSGWGATYLKNLTEPLVFTVTPNEGDITFPGSFVINCICESDFERLTSYPYRGDPKAAPWASYHVEHSFNLGLFPDGLDPFKDDCTREMTRGEFAEVLLKLYQRLGGSVRGLSRNTPFTDLPGDVHGYIPLAYNLGLVEGTSETTFSPNDSLTREQAAVMLCRVYEKFYGELPEPIYFYYEDKDQISPSAEKAVIFLAEQGIMMGISTGRGRGMFAPQRALTLQEGMVIVQRMLDEICFERH